MGCIVKVRSTAIAGVSIVETAPIADHRGSLTRFFCMDELSAPLGHWKIMQINHSHTAAAGAVRGLHFQHPPHAEIKMVRCLKGRVLDVAVDLRKGSPTFLKFHAQELTPGNARMIVIPEGCAHGFQTLEAGCELLYLHTAPYNKTAEGGLRHDDPALGIAWPLPVTDISDRDRSHTLISKDFSGVEV